MRPTDLREIEETLKQCYWYQSKIKNDNYKNTIFNRILNVYSKLDKSTDRDNLRKLIKNIEVYDLNDYFDYVQKCYIKLRSLYPTTEYFYILPLNWESPRNLKVKSGYLVSYLFNSYTFSYIDKENQFKSCHINSTRSLKSHDLKKLKEGKAVLVLVDDFIGTGSQAKEVIKKLEENYSDIYEKKCIISLIALQEGIEALKNNNVNHIYEVKGRTLKDFYIGEELESIKQTINFINDYYKIKKSEDKWRDSHALSVTYRTPNNAINFLWSKKLKDPIFFRNGG